MRNSYDEHVQYDDNGNIRSLQCNGGQDTLPPATEIDELTYFYDGNQLTKVTDTGDTSTGFKDVEQSGVDDYTYDAFGNLTSDNNKGITGITYNHLNQPVTLTVTRSGISHTISYLYNAAGVKLKKTVTPSGGTAVVTDYLGGYQYVGTVLEFFPTSEGYVKHTLVGSVSNYNYVFQYKDHLGNNRVSYTVDSDNVLKILEEDHYYPFGLKHEGYSATQSMLKGSFGTGVHIVPVLTPDDVTYKYMYNGKEFQDELGLNNYDFGARNYDPAIGRWMNIDPLAEQYYSLSPYNYAANNPIYFVDPDGRGLFDWIKHTDDYGRKTVTYDPNIHSAQEATDKGYNDVEKVFTEGSGTITGKDSEGNRLTENVQFSADGSYSVDGQSYAAKSSYFSVTGVKISYSKTGGEQWMEILHGVLDGIGFIPAVGEVADGANAGLYSLQGDTANAAMSSAAMIPLVGMAATGGKYATKYSDELVDAAKALYPKKAGKTELHHIVPKYLGGAKDGALVPLDAAYHQVITNEFRAIHPYGLPKPSQSRVIEIMDQVYGKYPLPH